MFLKANISQINTVSCAILSANKKGKWLHSEVLPFLNLNY